MLDTTAEALRTGPVDVIVHHPKALAGPHLAEALGVPALTATLMPLYVPTREFALPLLPARVPVPGPLVRPSWRLVSMIDSPYRGMIRRWRREVLGLPARSPTTLTTKPDGRPAPVPLQAWSGHLLPAPSDWPAAAAPLGFWFTPPRGPARPSEELTAFLDAGEPPVYLGFGSMVGRDPAGLARTVLEAVRLAGVRAVLATGWGGLRPGDQPHREVLVVDQARHDWLFARVSAVVHHGGIGTVAAAARAGRPQVIRPFLGDQPFWASQVHRLGLGPVPLTGGLNPQRLADALTTATRTPDFGHRARELATRMRSEDGLSAAIRRLTDLVDAPRGALD
jgi:sterol 3beta-glucosyltransferase